MSGSEYRSVLGVSTVVGLLTALLLNDFWFALGVAICVGGFIRATSR